MYNRGFSISLSVCKLNLIFQFSPYIISFVSIIERKQMRHFPILDASFGKIQTKIVSSFVKCRQI